MILAPVPLTKQAFAPFGEVIECAGAQMRSINQGFATRYHQLAKADVEDGNVIISIFTAKARPRPIKIDLMERHPLGSQAFFPLQNEPWLVVVAGDPRDLSSFCAFIASGEQGVNYAKNIWHFPLLVMRDESRFLVVDRAGVRADTRPNLEEVGVEGLVVRGG